MIELTRLNDTVLFINPDMILTVEAHPDTVVTLTNHDKLLVKESPEEIRRRYIDLKRQYFKEGFTVE